ncbi:MAG TPA: M20/M25/M40 family metallo-hydrolase [Thermoanaerobaculia bacterium]
MRRLLLLLIPFAVILAIALWRIEGPAPKPASAPAHEFSAARAMTTLRALLAEQTPHPLGSAANAVVRERIVAQFRSLGYDVTVQRRFACNSGKVCAEVQNVIARMPGARGAHAVAVAAHYDSVPAGPGATDDGVGTAAILEIARAVRRERFANPVVFLITDGEEAGLLGAEGFVADASLSRDVAAVISIENRGTAGPSVMFETSRNNRWLVSHYASTARTPITSSLFYTIYDMLPNDTDVSVFKRAGKGALNFGAVRNVVWYHSPFDDFAHVDPRTFQHHGDNGLAALRALGNADLARSSDGNATWFDVLGFFVLQWPQAWTLWLAIVSLAVLLFVSRRANARAITWGVVATFLAIVLAILGGIAISLLATARTRDAQWVATPGASIAAAWLIGIAASFCGFAMLRKRADADGLARGMAIVWHIAGIALAIFLPGAAFLLVVPAVVLTIALAARGNELAVALAGSTAAAILLFPLGIVLYDALGAGAIPALAILLALYAMTAAPAIASYRMAVIAAIAALVFAVVAMTLPAYTPQRPRALNLVYVDDAALPSPVWAANALTPPLERAAKFARTNPADMPWVRTPIRWSAPAPRLNLPRVAVTAARGANGLRVSVRSQRNAQRVALVFRSDAPVRGIRINGVVPPPPPERSRTPSINGWQFVTVWGTGADVDIDTSGKVEVVASDTTFGLPAEGAGLMRAREGSMAFPVHDGDVTITRTRAVW